MEVGEMALDGGGGYRDEEIGVVWMKEWCLIICLGDGETWIGWNVEGPRCLHV
jgi:hypothetical protein